MQAKNLTQLNLVFTTILGATFIASLTSCAGRPVGIETGSDGKNQPISAENQTEKKSELATNVTEAKQTGAPKKDEASAEYHFSLAQAYVAEGSPDRAIEEFKITLMFDPNSSLVYARLATEFIKKGMLTAAMETCKEALHRNPSFTDARLILAGLYSASHENTAALTEYDRILKSNPKNEEAAVYKSQVLMEENRSAEAVTLMRTFLKKSPDSGLGQYYLGRCEEKAGHFKEAVVAYRQVIDAHPNFAQAGLALGVLYEQKGMNAQAIAVYKDMVESNQDTTAANRLATIYLKQEKFKEAVPYLEAIQTADPDDMNVRVKLGLVLMELKQYDKAIASFFEILKKNPDSDRIHYYLGSLYEETKQMDLAISELKQIKADSKMFGDSTLHVGYLLKQEGKLEEAKTYMKESILKSPLTSSFYVFQASLEEDSKNLTGAVKILENASDKFPQDEKVRYYLGSIYDKQGETDKGMAQMELILKSNPENVDAMNYIGYTWTTKGIRLGEAEKLLQRALRLKPDNGYVQDSWGFYLFVRGRTQEAVVELEKAARLRPNEPSILEHLGDAYLRSNLREKAMRKYEDAAKFAEENTTKTKLEAKVETLRQELATQPLMSPTNSPNSVIRMPASSSQK